MEKYEVHGKILLGEEWADLNPFIVRSFSEMDAILRANGAEHYLYTLHKAHADAKFSFPPVSMPPAPTQQP